MGSEVTPGPASRRPWSSIVRDADVRVGLVTAAALLVQAVVAKNVLHVTLDFASQYASMWVFLAFMWVGRKDRASELGAICTVLAVTAAVLVLYAF